MNRLTKSIQVKDQNFLDRYHCYAGLRGIVISLMLSVPGVNAAPPAINQLPTGAKVVGGQASVGQSAAVMTINQTTNRAAVTWDTFNVGSAATVNIQQPSVSSVILNQVLDTNPSQIFGNINANGQVFLANPNGVYFSPTASVNVGGLVATTNSINADQFMAGLNTFSSNRSTASVINDGNLKTTLRGYIALLAPTVRNNGIIIAQMGTVALASGDAYELQFSGNSLTNVRVTPSIVSALVENGNAIYAPGGLIILSALAAHEIRSGVIGNTGVIDATGVTSVGGVIQLTASRSIDISGSVKADAAALKNSTGGTVTITADPSNIGSRVDISGVVSSNGNSSKSSGGIIKIQGSDIALSGQARIAATGATNGGMVDIGTSKVTFDQNSAGVRSNIVAIDLAQTVSLGAATQVDASSIGLGNGGTINIWSAAQTNVAGTIKATGGERGGNGGAIETSSSLVLRVAGTVLIDTSAPLGKIGLWMLDPTSLTLSGDTATAISNALTNNNVTISVVGDLTLAASAVIAPKAGASTILTLDATGTIVNNGTIAGTASSSLIMNANTLSLTSGSTTSANQVTANAQTINVDGVIAAVGGSSSSVNLTANAVTIAGTVSANGSSGATATTKTVAPVAAVSAPLASTVPSHSRSHRPVQKSSVTTNVTTPVANLGATAPGVVNSLSSGPDSFATNVATTTTNTNTTTNAAPIPFTRNRLSPVVTTVASLTAPNTNIVTISNYSNVAITKAINTALASNTAGTTTIIDVMSASIVPNRTANPQLASSTFASTPVMILTIGPVIELLSNVVTTPAFAGTSSSGGTINITATSSLTTTSTSSISANAGASAEAGNGGSITLMAKLDNASSVIKVNGSLTALGGAQGGNGGFIETSGSKVSVGASSSVSTVAPRGRSGTWLIDPTDFTIAASGGDITGLALSAALATSYVALSSAGTISGSAAAGNINVNDVVSWSANQLTLTAANNININAAMNISGTGTLVMNTATTNTTGLNVSSAVAGGTVNVGLATSGASLGQFLGSVNFTQSGQAVNGNNLLTINTHPYTIINNFGLASSTTSGDFQAINAAPTGYYALGSNLIATGVTATPIAVFTGAFNGLGHTITGVNITSAAGTGVFAIVSLGSTIQNIGLVGGTTQGGVNSGGLVGDSFGTISNSYNTGSVSSTGGGIGGLVGRNEAGTISNSYASGAVAGAVNVGGLIGYNDTGLITNVYATGSVTSAAAGVGGLVGYSSTGDIVNSHATGVVIGATGVGGLLGGGTSGNITNDYATGTVTGTTNTGGLVGSITSGVVSLSYAIGNVNGTTSTGGLVGLTTGLITMSYATGNVTGATSTGGLVANTTGNVRDSYASGNVIGSAGSSGGLIGTTTGTVSTSYASGSSVTGLTNGLIGTTSVPAGVTNSYFNGTLNNGGGTGATLTTAQMMTMSSFAGFSISNTGASSTWLIYDGVTTPLLSAFLTPVTITSIYSGAQPAAFNNISGYTSNVAIDPSKLITTSAGLTLSSTGTAGSETAILSGFGTTQQGYRITYAATTITGTGSLANDLNISAPINWSSGTLTLNAQNNINFNSVLSGSLTAQLALNYGLSAVALNNPSDYVVNKVIDLPGGQNFKTTFGSDGITKNYMVITTLGVVGDATTSPLLTTLQGMAASSNLAKNFVLGNNIDASATAGAAYNGSAGFVPVGTTSFTYAGYFDGLGHTIANLNFNTGATANAGLFGYTMGLTRIQNVGLIGGSMNGGAATGGLVGYNDSGSIRNSYNTGNVTGAAFTGGLVGQNLLGNINNSYTTGIIVGAAYTGGLVGGATTGNISNSYATGSVHGAAGTGGLIGTITTGIISNSYATGSVLGGAGTGGLVGTSTGLITTSYATGVVTGTVEGVPGAVGAAGVGGLVGTTSGEVSVSFASGSVSGGAGVGGLIGTSTGLTLNTYATGTVTAQTIVGGLIGSTTGAVQNSYAAGVVTGEASNTGALIGTSSVPNSNNFFDSQSNPVTMLGVGAASVPGNVTGMTTTNMMSQANFTSSTLANNSTHPTWDFADTWVLSPGTMPFLRMFMKPIVVTANSATTIYSGSAYVGGATYSVTPTPVLGGTLSYSYLSGGVTSTTATNAGTYLVTPKGLLSTQQYLVSFAAGTVLISPAPLGIAVNSTYNGTTGFTSTLSSSGLVGGDTLTGVVAFNANVAGNATNYVTSISGVAGSTGAVNINNYAISGNQVSAVGATQNIVTLVVAPLGISNSTATYAGSTTLSGANGAYVLTGLVGGDTTETVNTATLNSANVGTGNFFKTVILSGANQANYALNAIASTHLGTSITNIVSLAAAPLGLSNSTATYAGSTTLSGANGAYVLTGLVGGDTNETVNTATINSANVANARLFTSLTLSGDKQANYALNVAANDTLGTHITNTVSVAAAPLGITVSGLNSGTTTIAPTSFTTNGLVNGETITSLTTAILNSPNVSDNGSNYVVSIVSGGGTAAVSNYAITQAFNVAPNTNTTNTATINSLIPPIVVPIIPIIPANTASSNPTSIQTEVILAAQLEPNAINKITPAPNIIDEIIPAELVVSALLPVPTALVLLDSSPSPFNNMMLDQEQSSVASSKCNKNTTTNDEDIKIGNRNDLPCMLSRLPILDLQVVKK